jgi:multiple sugar transport system permease protein
MRKTSNGMGWLFTSPYILFGIIFFVIPLVWSFFLAFTDWNLISPEFNFVGIDNFIEAITSQSVQSAFVNTYKFLIIYVPIVMALSLTVAMVVNGLPKFKGFFLIGFFLPYLSSGVVTSLIVNGILSYNGPLNTFLREKLSINIDWLGTPIAAVLIVSIMIAWKFAGYYGLILFSGLSGIEKEIYEAAAIDGASRWQTFWKITIPMLYPALYTVLILAIGVSFGIFTEVYQLTGGGPDFATNTWQMEIFTNAFTNLQAGYSSAIALIAAVVTFVSIYIVRKLIELWGRRNGWE